jgi:hypothetical protein
VTHHDVSKEIAYLSRLGSEPARPRPGLIREAETATHGQRQLRIRIVMDVIPRFSIGARGKDRKANGRRKKAELLLVM